MADQAKNILIGLFVIAAFAIVTFMLLFLHPTVGDDSKRYRIRFSDIDKVTIGTRATYGGKAVGEVVEIKIVEDPDHPREATNGSIYLYEVTIVVDSSVEIYNSDLVTLRTSGLLGEKSVAITPQPPKPGVVLEPVGTKNVIYADETGSVEQTLKEFKEVSDKFEETLNAILTTVQDINNEHIVQKVSDAVQNIVEITKVLNDKDVLRNILTNAENFTADLAKHEGTLGQLIKKDDLYLRTNALFSKAEVALNDINHYGIFFASDKNWQRARARKANLLCSLRCPQEFKNFFNDEVDSIYTSLARVTNVLEESTNFGCCVENNPNYKIVFAELLRRVKQMEESVQFYNQQLMEPETCITELCEP